MSREIMKVGYTPDGDTIRCFRIITENEVTRAEEVRIRLAYIDAPEIGNRACRAYAISARAYLRRLLYVGEPVEARILGKDVYGRLIAEIIRLRDYGNCGLRLAHGGYAALYSCPLARWDYQAAQEIAQQKRRGIWRNPGPWQTPWLYR